MDLKSLLVGDPNDPSKRSLLGFLGDLPGLLTPGSQGPVGQPGQENLSDDQLKMLRDQYKVQFDAQRARAVAGGATQPQVGALASAPAQDSYNDTVNRALISAKAIRDQQDRTAQEERLKQLTSGGIPGFSKQQLDVLAALPPDLQAQAAMKAAFPDSKDGKPVPVTGGYVYQDPEKGWVFAPTKQDEKIDVLSDGTVVKVGADGKITRDVPTQSMGTARAAAVRAAATAAGNAVDPNVARAIARRDVPMPVARSGKVSPYVAAVLQIDPAYKQGDYALMNQARSRIVGGKDGGTIRALNVAVGHIDVLRDIVDQIDNGSFTPGNWVANEFEQVFGAAAPTSFEATRDVVADEIAKAVIGGTNAEKDREKFASRVALSRSPAQLKTVMEDWQKLMAGQLRGFRTEYSSLVPASTFDAMVLDPRTVDVLDKYKGVAPAAATGAPPPPKKGWGVVVVH